MPMMVVCPEPLAAAAGIEVLRGGGNAVDAAIATSLVQGVVNPKLCGIGGHGRMMIFLRKENSVRLVDAMSRAGSKAIPGVFEYLPDMQPEDRTIHIYAVRGRMNEIGYQAMTVPGFVAGIGVAHEKWGRLKWGGLFEPAIKLAKSGFQVYPYLVRTGFLDSELPALAANETARKIYTRNGRALRVGETLVQREYGETLETIAKEGYESFYSGSIGRKIAEDLESNGSLVTFRDLESYRATMSEPMRISYGGYEAYSDGPPGSGPMKLEALKVLEKLETERLGWNTPDYLDVISRTFQFAMNDRERYTVDPESDERAQDDARMMISEAHAGELARRVAAGEAVGPHRKPKTREMGRKENTTTMTCIDDEGNVVAFYHSIMSSSGVVTPGLGFLYNSHMSAMDPRQGQRLSMRPGRVPVVSPSPLMVFRKDEFCLSVGSPGGPWGSTAEIQALMNIQHFGMSAQSAVSTPRVHSEIYARTVYVEPSFPQPYPLENLRSMGYDVQVSTYSARLSAIHRDPSTGKVDGGADPRGAGGLGYAS